MSDKNQLGQPKMMPKNHLKSLNVNPRVDLGKSSLAYQTGFFILVQGLSSSHFKHDGFLLAINADIEKWLFIGNEESRIRSEEPHKEVSLAQKDQNFISFDNPNHS